MLLVVAMKEIWSQADCNILMYRAEAYNTSHGGNLKLGEAYNNEKSSTVPATFHLQLTHNFLCNLATLF